MNAARKRLLAAAMAAVLALVPLAGASARGGFRGGGFRSAGSLRSFSSSARALKATRFSGWGSATRPRLGASAPSSRRSLLGSRSSVSSQRGLYDSARRNGTLFSTKDEAAQAFRSRYARDFGSTFASEPAARPSYIPSTTMVGGRSVNIVYSPALGGYGYLHPTLGTWMLFDALSDAAALDLAMSSRGYYYGGPPVYVSHGSGFMAFALIVLVLLVAAAAVAARSAAARRSRYRDYGRRGNPY